MSDYISRKAVKRQILNSFVTDEFCSTEADTFIADNLILKEIDKVPTADVQEVKRGKWVDREADLGYEVYQCSVCKEEYCLETGSSQENGYNFCPICGADMRGDKG